MKKKFTVKQKCFHFIGFPILFFFAGCLMFIISNYILGREIRLSSDNIMTASAVAVGYSITHWIALFYPSKPKEEPNKQKKSVKEYVQQYVIKGTPFNRLIVFVYTIGALILLVIMIVSMMK